MHFWLIRLKHFMITCNVRWFFSSFPLPLHDLWCVVRSLHFHNSIMELIHSRSEKIVNLQMDTAMTWVDFPATSYCWNPTTGTWKSPLKLYAIYGEECSHLPSFCAKLPFVKSEPSQTFCGKMLLPKNNATIAVRNSTIPPIQLAVSLHFRHHRHQLNWSLVTAGSVDGCGARWIDCASAGPRSCTGRRPRDTGAP